MLASSSFRFRAVQLLDSKHPTAWVEFEMGRISEQELCEKFFKDGRYVDVDRLTAFMHEAYRFVDGMEDLLERLNAADVEMHVVSNYPVWHSLIEKKLLLSRYMKWSFLSCEGPMKGLRKPSPEAFDAVVRHLDRRPCDLVFVDDRSANVQAAAQMGMNAFLFEGAEKLEEDLCAFGLEF